MHNRDIHTISKQENSMIKWNQRSWEPKNDKKETGRLGMKKTITRTILSLCIALSVFMCNSSFALAAVCPDGPGGTHYFRACGSYCVRIDAGYSKNCGTHEYLYGYDAGKPIYRND